MTTPIQILLVEDHAADVRLTVEALRETRVPTDVHFVGDGEEAVAYLRGEGVYAKSPRPDLILLDLNLPRMDGRELLALIKADEALRAIPVVVVTTSSAEADVQGAYALGANSYIVKPVDFEQFRMVIDAIDRFWFSVVRFPTRP